MNLYYVCDEDNSYRLVVYATCEHDAKCKAGDWVRKNRYMYMPAYCWSAVICDNRIVIE